LEAGKEIAQTGNIGFWLKKIMKHFTREGLDNIPSRKRANLINSATGYKPANLIGTVSAAGETNLAIFSSLVHLGANPPLIGFIQRPVGEVPRHTYENIKATGVYTINHIHRSFVKKAHFTSAKFERGVSEFAACELNEEYIENFKAPFVAESKVKLGVRFIDEMPIRQNGTILVIGEIEHVILPENAILEGGNIDLNSVEDVAISGLDTYHEVAEIKSFPYAKPERVPEF
jgi:flavin reductase (DIM6/NTAB) family NADH-FMN oxidoreductase RutF